MTGLHDRKYVGMPVYKNEFQSIPCLSSIFFLHKLKLSTVMLHYIENVMLLNEFMVMRSANSSTSTQVSENRSGRRTQFFFFFAMSVTLHQRIASNRMMGVVKERDHKPSTTTVRHH